MNKKRNMTFGLIDKFVKKLFAEEFHHKQVMSMGLFVLGVLYADRLGVAAIGTGLAKARGTTPKHGIKQFDRFLRNKKIRMADFQKRFATTVVNTRKKILVTMDWTDFDADGHTVLVLSLVTRSKRALPLIWTVVQKSTLKGTRNLHEKTAVQMLRQALPVDVHMIILADRGFGDTAFFDHLVDIENIDFVIRFKANYLITCDGIHAKAADLVPKIGRIRLSEIGVLQPVFVFIEILDCRFEPVPSAFVSRTGLGNLGEFLSKVFEHAFCRRRASAFQSLCGLAQAF